MTPKAPSSRRTIAVLTSGRQDWGILRSTCLAIREDSPLTLRLIAGGMHLSARYGSTIEEIRADGFTPDDHLNWLALPPQPELSADQQAAQALATIGRALSKDRPVALVLAGDRLETAAAALAATLARVPIIHLHGGEQTGGAFDDSLRHAITKLANLHLVSHDEHRLRVESLGEDPATIRVVGAPALDSAFRTDLPNRTELEASLGVSLSSPLVIVSVHPATLDPEPQRVAECVVAALDEVSATYVITLPNSDPGNDGVRAALRAAAAKDPARRVVVEALGTRRYWGLLRIADAMLGNSSSGIIEAPAVMLPAVDVGERQQGRHRESNVISVGMDRDAIVRALRRALDPATKVGLGQLGLPLADGLVGRRIADIIAAWQPSDPPRKAPVVLRP